MKLDRAFAVEELPIPKEARPTKRWTGQMLEMAAHIGPYLTLLLCDRLGGQDVYVPIDPAANRMVEIIGNDATSIMSHVYGANLVSVPVARHALLEARRAPVIAAIREGKMTIAEAVPILRVNRSHLSHLVNHSDEGTDAASVTLPSAKRDPRQHDMFDPGEDKPA